MRKLFVFLTTLILTMYIQKDNHAIKESGI